MFPWGQWTSQSVVPPQELQINKRQSLGVDQSTKDTRFINCIVDFFWKLQNFCKRDATITVAKFQIQPFEKAPPLSDLREVKISHALLHVSFNNILLASRAKMCFVFLPIFDAKSWVWDRHCFRNTQSDMRTNLCYVRPSFLLCILPLFWKRVHFANENMKIPRNWAVRCAFFSTFSKV